MVISLKKYLDMDGPGPRESSPDPVELLPIVTHGLSRSADRYGEKQFQGCATVSEEMQQSLAGLEATLKGNLRLPWLHKSRAT